MRVLFIAGWQTPYGDFIKEHCKAVSKFNEVYYVYISFNKTLKGFPYKIDIKEETHDKIHFFNIEVNCYLRRFGVYEKLVKLAFHKVLKRINLPFDIVHVNVRTPETEIITLDDSISELPKVITLHSSFYHTGIYKSFSGEKLHNEKHRIIDWFKNVNFSKVIVVSDFLGNVLNKDFKISSHKLVKVPNTVSGLYNFKNKQIEHKINICLIANWIYPKNPMMFVRSLELIDEILRSKICINWIGRGEQLTEVKEFVNSKLKDIQINFIGPVYEKEKLTDYLKGADLFVHPTDAENLPCVIIESICCGTPVLSNTVGGVPELINESNGILVEPNNPEKFAAAFQEIIDNISNYNNEKISESAVKEFSYNSVGKQITQIYETVLNPNANYIQCTRCVMDNQSNREIWFNENGVCRYCEEFDVLSKQRIQSDKEGIINEVIKEIKKAGVGKKYDCILGVSGGVDSSYTAYLLKAYNLNPLIVHFDNSWNSQFSVKNIESIVDKLGFDLYTEVVDWDEFRDIQLSFLKASVVDIELVTDYAINTLMYIISNKYNVKYIITGHNYSTESIMPSSWVHAKSDLLNIRDIHKRFGSIPMKTFPQMGYFKKAYYVQLKKIKVLPLLNYVEYDKEKAKKIIIEKLDWKDYGGKHTESFFTKFYQNYILPTKFKIDKRKAHLSSLICSGQISKDEALKELDKNIYDESELRNDKAYFIKKMQLTGQEFNDIMSLPIKKHTHYKSYVTRHYKYEVLLSKKLKFITRPIKKILGIKVENNYI